MNNIETTQKLYDAFGRGDVPAFLELLADDVRWEQWDDGNGAQDGGVAYMAERTGRVAAAGYFADLGGLEIRSVVPGAILEGESQVAVVVKVSLDVTATGKHVDDEEIHLWEFGPDGKVVRMRHFLDTAKHRDAAS